MRSTITTILCSILFLSIIMLAACGSNVSVKQAALPPHQYSVNSDSQRDDRKQLLQQFVANKLTGSHGIYTNYIDTAQNELAATGHEVLSESMGLLMRVYALTRDQIQFDKAWELAEQTFAMESGFSYRFSPKLNKLYSVNAAVDDLRMIRALYEAEEAFANKRYGELADKLSARFMKHNVRDGKLFDFYDNEHNMTNAFITLCYIDLRTLQLMPEGDKKDVLAHSMHSIIQGGYLSDDFPFYETRYDYSSEQYESDEIRTIESLLTILSLVEVGQHHPKSIDYLKEQVQQGTLYGRYTRDGQPLTTIQSTAIYAITAMIGSRLGDQSLYEDSMSRMEQFQVLYQQSELYGAYGDIESLQAFSFDNLMALLAYAY